MCGKTEREREGRLKGCGARFFVEVWVWGEEGVYKGCMWVCGKRGLFQGVLGDEVVKGVKERCS